MGYLKTLLRKNGISKADIEQPIRKAQVLADYDSEDFVECFLNHLVIIGDSREQDDWIARGCGYYNIAYKHAVKDKKTGNENLKEGDYSYQVVYGDTIFNYVGVVAYERKGSLSEIYNNLKSGDRERVEREFERFIEKQYKKVVLVLEYGKNESDTLNGKFDFIDHDGLYNTRDVGKLVFTSLMAWKQPNAFNFEIHQEQNHTKLFWWIIMDMYYYFRNELKNKLKEKKESEENEDSVNAGL